MPSKFLVARNRLVEITDRAIYGGDPTQIVDYLYDLENRWIGKRVDSDGDGVFDSQEGYVYDGNQMVLRFEGDVLSNRYLWQPDAVDQLMADEQIETDDVVLALTDHLGTVRDLAVMDNGETSVVNHITYDSYGQKLSETAAVDCLFGFTGRAFDEETGMQNNLNRWYDASTGRWLSKDPIGFEGRDANTYRYVGNVPTNVTDPSGLWGTDVHLWLTGVLANMAGMTSEGCRIVQRAANAPDQDWRDPIESARRYFWDKDMSASKYVEASSWHFPLDPDGNVRPSSIAAKKHYKDALDPKKTLRLSDEKVLQMFGEGLHVLQDSYSHNGIPVVAGITGHPQRTILFWGGAEMKSPRALALLSHKCDDVSVKWADARNAGFATWKAFKELKQARPDLFPGQMASDQEVIDFLASRFPKPK